MDRLRNFNILQRSSYRCVLCDLEDETNYHLFIHCSFVWEVWGECLSWFGVAWVTPSNLKRLMESWFDSEFRTVAKRRWISCFFAVIWSVWIIRNKIIFENGIADRNQLVEQIRHYG